MFLVCTEQKCLVIPFLTKHLDVHRLLSWQLKRDTDKSVLSYGETTLGVCAQGYSSLCKWNCLFFSEAQARCSVCQNSAVCAEKLELRFIYCHVLRAATFVQIRSEVGRRKAHPSLN